VTASDAPPPENAQTPKPVMIAIGGLSGSGKTTLAYLLSRHLPDTVVLDSDVLRKRMHGHPPLAPLPDAVYRPALTAQFIDYARRTAVQHMKEGKSVIVTGLFTDTQSRDGQKAAAQNAGGSFIGLYLETPAAQLFKRVARRRDNPSDAHIDTLRRQIRSNPSQPAAGEGWHVLQAGKGLGRTLHHALRIIRREDSHDRHGKPVWKPF
jgi:uncharacterized protein